MDRILSVSLVNRYIKSILESDVLLSSVLVRGEIANFKRHGSGHWYFSLRDEAASINCVMFKYSCDMLSFVPENGMSVTISGRVSLYEKTGQYQLYADTMEPVGIGSLTLAFEQMKAKLEKEGLFSQYRKRSIPQYPRRVAIVTSATGAAVRDIIEVASKRNPYVELILAPCLVQGERAAADIARALRLVNDWGCADVVILGRGGGSLEDLWPFNEEAVARAVFMSKTPVISAVGHETDVTICDFVADLRAPTPSAAAMAAVPTLEQTHGLVKAYAERLNKIMLRKISDFRRQFVANPFQNLNSALRRTLENRAMLADGYVTALEHLSPLKTLGRGYAIVSRKDGAAVSSTAELEPGDLVSIRLRDGTADAEIKEKCGGQYGEEKIEL